MAGAYWAAAGSTAAAEAAPIRVKPSAAAVERAPSPMS